MSSKIIVDTIEKKTGDDVTLVGNLDVPTSYKITGTDADSIQAPGLITSAGSGLNTSLNTALNSATLGTGTTFPAGHIIQIVTNIPSTVTQATTTTTSFAEIQTDMRTEITPKFASSLLVLEFSCMHGGNNTSNILSAKFYDITNSSDIHATLPARGTGSTRPFCHGSSRQNDADGNDRETFQLRTVINAQNTNARTYSVYAFTEGATHYWNMTVTDNSGCTYAPFCFTIMEIAQ